MQCNYLGSKSVSINLNECVAGPGVYETDEAVRKSYCKDSTFRSCPRYVAALEINKSNASIIESDKTKK